MLAYDHLLNVILPPLLSNQSLVPLTAGVIARTAVSTIMSPLELIRTNLQSTPASPNIPNTLNSVLISIQACIREQGVRSLWRGLGPTLWRDVPFSGLYWAGYESMKTHFRLHHIDGVWVAFVSGALSGTMAALVTSPMDVLKTRRQAFIMTPVVNSRVSNISLFSQIIRIEGVSALFAGTVPRMAKIAPACGIMIACFEVSQQLLSHSC
jgi:solute carrier family 25, member 39/40